MAESLLRGRMQSGSPYNALLGEFLGKPYREGAGGPDAYDCYGLCRAFMARLGVELPDLGATSIAAAESLHQQAEPAFIKLTWPRPWSLISLRRNGTLATHCGIVLPTDGLFLHAQEKSGVVAEPIAHRYWHPRIEGYYWPRGVVEVVIMHSPVGLEHSWAFFREGLSLAQMFGLAPEEQAQIRVFLDGKEVERGAWSETFPTARNQVVVRPQYGDGRTAFATVAMMFLMMVAGPVGTGIGLEAGTPSMAVFQAGVMVAGGYLLGALIGPKKPDNRQESLYGWNPQTTQREGIPIPRLYGRVPVQGNIIMAYGDVTNTPGTYDSLSYRVAGYTNPVIYPISISHTFTANSDYSWNVKLAYGDGPINGIVAGTEKINGQALDAYTGLSLEHRRGTDSQTATAIGDRIQYDPQIRVQYGTPQVYTLPDKDIDRIAVVVGFPQGVIHYNSSGDSCYRDVGLRVEIRPAGGAWHVLADTTFTAKTTRWVHEIFYNDQSCEGGSPLALARGTQYEIRLTRTSEDGGDQSRDQSYLEAVQGIYHDGFRYPGYAYTAISALASEKLSGSLQFEAIVEGRILQIYDGATWKLAYSNNPAWVLLDLLTRPVIKGDGAGTPYEIEYYRGVDRSWIDTNAFYALAQWCDELVPDGNGGTEKRFVFNGSLEDEDEAWQVALRVAALCRAWPYFNGRQITVAIDKAATPVQAFTVGNILRGDFDETWFDEQQKITEIDYTILDEKQDYRRTPVCIIDQEATYRVPLTAEGWGTTSQSQLYRIGIHQLTVNRLMPRSVEFPADLDALYCKIGDVIYVQHNNMDVNQGGRIVAVSGNTITVDFDPKFDVCGYSILVRTVSEADGENPTLYSVASVSGRDITITLPDWVYPPEPNDVVMYGQATQINDLYRIRTMQRSEEGQVRIFATAYDENYYGPDALAPIIATQQALAAARADRNLRTRPPSWDQLNAAYPPEQINASPADDQPRISSLTFTGDGVNTTTWAGSDIAGHGCILYQGHLVWIAPNPTGTTARYIYFDPQAADPTILGTTDDRADLEGYERFIFCISVDGVAYPQPGVRLGRNATLMGVEEGADVTADHQADINADEITEGVMGIKTFHEYFRDPNSDVAFRWHDWSGTANIGTVAGGLSGDKFLRIGDHAGDDEAWLIYERSIPFDPGFLYRMQCRIRRLAGAGLVYVGVAGRNSDDTAWVNNQGLDTRASQHYVCASGAEPGSEWTTYVGYFRGFATEGDALAQPDPSAPGALNENVRWIRPCIYVNISHQPGIVDVDEISLEVVPEQIQNSSNVSITGGTISGLTSLGINTVPAVPLHVAQTGDAFTPVASFQNATAGASTSTAVYLGNDVTVGGGRLILNANARTTDPNLLSLVNAITGGDLALGVNNTEVLRIQSDGKVGIGIATPGQRLEVAGNILVTSTTAFLSLKEAGWTNAQFYLQTGVNPQASASGDCTTFCNPSGKSYSFYFHGASNLYLDGASGNVGIGTTGPGALLDVANDAGANLVQVMTRAASTPGALRVGGSNIGLNMEAGQVQFSPYTFSQSGAYASVGGGWSDSTTQGYLAFRTSADGGVNNTEKVRIDHTGNVGLGTVNPSSRLCVANTTIALRHCTGADGASPAWELGYDAPTGVGAGVYLYSTAHSYLVHESANGNLLLLHTGQGSVGIGVADPGAYKLSVGGNTYINGALSLATDLALAHGGTGASDALAAKLNLRLPVTNVLDYGAVGDGVTDDTTALQNAINAALANQRRLVIPRPAVAYKITNTLYISSTGTDNASQVVMWGFDVVGEGQPEIRWAGSGTKPMLKCIALAESRISNVMFNGNYIAGVSGVVWTTASGRPAQRNSFDHVWVVNCPGYGIDIFQNPANGATADYYHLHQCCLDSNGVNLFIRGGVRQCVVYGGSITNATTYNVQIGDPALTNDGGILVGFDMFVAGAGTCDIYLSAPITAFKLFGGGSESAVIVKTAPGIGGSHLVGPCVMNGFQQSAVSPAATVIDYDTWQPLILNGCKFQGNVNIGASCDQVTATGVDFSPAGDFIGAVNKLLILARPADGNSIIYSGLGMQIGGYGSWTHPLTIDADCTGAMATDNGNAHVVLRGKSNTNYRLALGVDTSTGVGRIQAGQYTVGTSALTLNPAGGNVGVGVAAPEGRLHLLETGGSGLVPTLILHAGAAGASGPAINFCGYYGGNYPTANWKQAQMGSIYENANYQSSLVFQTNTGSAVGDLSEKMRITSGGNVGMGTASPYSRLHVQNTGATGYNMMRLNNDQVGNTYGWWMTLASGAGNGTDRGYFGVGHPAGGIDSIFIGEVADSIGLRSSGYLHLGSGATPGLTIDPANNVAIGTTNPGSCKLYIAGGDVGSLTLSQSVDYAWAAKFVNGSNVTGFLKTSNGALGVYQDIDVSPTLAFEIHADGFVYFGKGVNTATFQTADGKTVTVTGGLITSIV